MKSNTATRITFLFIALTSLFGLQSCKEDTILNANLVPAGDTVNSIIIPDTITILTKTFFDDSIVTSLTVTGVPIYHALGAVSAASDPYSGNTKAGIYVQIVQPSPNFNFPQTPDSAALILPYAGFTWGDTTTGLFQQEFNVYEVTETLQRDTLYYSGTNKTFDPTVLGSATISSYAILKDSATDLGSKRASHLRIPLNSTFLNKMKSATSDNLSSYANFLSYFKGLYIEPKGSTANSNALFYFRLDGTDNYSRANVLFYYTDAGTVKTTSFYFNPEQSAHYNKITRDYTGTPTGNFMASTNPFDSVFIIQNEPGAAADIIIPHIKNLPKNPINKAELVITQYSFLGDNADKYVGPPRIYPSRINSDGTSQAVQDRYPLEYTDPLLFMDGARKTTTIAGITFTQYTLNIPREVQTAIIEQKDQLHLRITGASGFPGAYRLIAGGTNLSNSNVRIKLNIVFSKI